MKCLASSILFLIDRAFQQAQVIHVFRWVFLVWLFRFVIDGNIISLLNYCCLVVFFYCLSFALWILGVLPTCRRKPQETSDIGPGVEWRRKRWSIEMIVYDAYASRRDVRLRRVTKGQEDRGSFAILFSIFTIDAFPYYCPGARRGNVFVATRLLRPRPRSTSKVLYESPTVTMYYDVVLARFSVWSSIFDFFWCWEDQGALSRPLFCFSLNNCKKIMSVPRPCFFPASRKTTPSSIAGCLVRISGSTVVFSEWVTLWLSTVECCRRRDREVSWQSFSPESEPFEARSRG